MSKGRRNGETEVGQCVLLEGMKGKQSGENRGSLSPVDLKRRLYIDSEIEFEHQLYSENHFVTGQTLARE